MSGPAPKPTALRLLQGNPGNRPVPKGEPKPEPGLPEMPRWLDRTARGFYTRVGRELENMGVMTKADGEALAHAADAYSEYRKARAACRKGLTYATKTQSGATMRRARPEVAMASDCWRRLYAFFTQFGLTPSSRSKVQIAGGAEKEDPLDEFFR